MTYKDNQPIKWSAWLLWTLVNILGFVIGIGLSLLSGEMLGETLSFIAFGLAVGFAQWLVLRKFIQRSGWWILATLLGSTLGLALTNTIHRALLGISGYLVAGILGLAALGLVVGVAQWVILRRYLSKAGWWILVNAAGWLVGVAASWALRLQFIEFIKIMADFAVLGTIVGASTGCVLLFLLRGPAPLEDRKTSPIRIWTMIGCSLVLIIAAGVRDHSGRAPISLDPIPDLTSVPNCGNLPSQDCDEDGIYCSEIVYFEPTTGPGYINYPVNGEKWDDQYRSYLRRDLQMLIKYSSARVACETASWDDIRFVPVGLGDMSEGDGAIPGTSTGHPGHPLGTHQDGNDIDVAYFQKESTWIDLTLENSPQGLEGNFLRHMCKYTRYGIDVYHCMEPPQFLDPWRTALFIAYLAENPYLRVIGVDGQIGPVLETALDQLVQSGWIDAELREGIPLAYEVTNEGMGWFRFHHHHLHISMQSR